MNDDMRHLPCMYVLVDLISPYILLDQVNTKLTGLHLFSPRPFIYNVWPNNDVWVTGGKHRIWQNSPEWSGKSGKVKRTWIPKSCLDPTSCTYIIFLLSKLPSMSSWGISSWLSFASPGKYIAYVFNLWMFVCSSMLARSELLVQWWCCLISKEKFPEKN